MSDIIKELVGNFVEIYNLQERFLGGGVVIETDDKWIKMRCEANNGESIIRIIKIDVIGRISCCDDEY
ncbi:MAG: cytochrome P450 [Ruminococcus sp.]|nr:cytochrome P450 [Ruminococcus sp.]MDE6848828.1 cytochrome P450 [Ruminococcus sp.]MDE7137819.1 cytochrome P450 [Ruminococcus sp.]